VELPKILAALFAAIDKGGYELQSVFVGVQYQESFDNLKRILIYCTTQAQDTRQMLRVYTTIMHLCAMHVFPYATVEEKTFTDKKSVEFIELLDEFVIATRAVAPATVELENFFDYKHPEGLTLLGYFASIGCLGAVTRLLDKGAIIGERYLQTATCEENGCDALNHCVRQFLESSDSTPEDRNAAYRVITTLLQRGGESIATEDVFFLGRLKRS